MEEKRNSQLLYAFFFPALFVGLMWVVMLLEYFYDIRFAGAVGLLPRSMKGLIGIICSPFLHGDWNHIINNSVPMLLLGGAIFHFYRKIAFSIYFYSALITGLWVWVAARESIHIGASGMVYAFASFIFFSGVFRRNVKLMALSMLVVFLYGSMIWGVLPIKDGVSWESHMFGGMAGLMLAYHFRARGPRKPVYSWELEEEEEIDPLLDAAWRNGTNQPQQPKRQIKVIFKPNPGKKGDLRSGEREEP